MKATKTPEAKPSAPAAKKAARESAPSAKKADALGLPVAAKKALVKAVALAKTPATPPAKPAAKAVAKAPAKPAAKTAAKPAAPTTAAAKAPAKKAAKPGASLPTTVPPPAAKPASPAAPTGKSYPPTNVKADADTHLPTHPAPLTPSPVPPGLDPATLIGRVQGEVATPPPSEAAQSDAGKPGPARAEAEGKPALPGMDHETRRRHIAIEAYLIAESRGFPPNCEHEHWLEAERRLFGKK